MSTDQVPTTSEPATPDPSSQPAPEEPTVVDQLLDGQGETPPESPDPSEPRQPALTEQLQELGFQDVSEADAQARLVEAYRQQQAQVEALRQQQAQLAQLAQYGNQYLQQLQQQPEQPTTPVSEGDHWWTPPQLDQSLVDKYRRVTTDENGNQRTTWVDGTPPEIRAQSDAYDRYVEKWAEDIVRNPDKVLPKIVEREFDRLFQERFQTITEQQRAEQVVQDIFASNSEWLYEKDPRTGQVAFNPDSSPRFTPAGQLAMQYLDQASQMGITDPAHQWNYVQTSMQAHRTQAQQPKPDPEQLRRQHLQSAAQQATPNRAGSMQTPEQPLSTPQNANLSPGHDLVAQMEAEGVL